MRTSTQPHILIVEDDGDLLEVLKFVLEDEGYRVSTAEGGADALSLAASQEVSLVLLDIEMPGISGIEVARRLRADPRTANIVLALHTGRAAADVREQFTDYDAFIAKTEDVPKLVAAIKAALGRPIRTPMIAESA
jgi:two-component system, OmpR family, phosphate regulon response regulator PhoB